MKKKVFALGSAFTVMLTTVTFSSGTSIQATSSEEIEQEINELENKKEDITEEKSTITNQQEETEQKIATNQAEQERINNEIISIDQQLTQTETEIATTEGQIEETIQEIEELEKNIGELETRIAERNELLKNRLRTLQQNGGEISYLEVILGAKDFGDFVSRSNAVNTIMGQDKKIMDQQKTEVELLQVSKIEVEEKKTSLEDQKETLVALEKQLSEQRSQKETLMAQLEHEEEELHKYQMTLQEEADLLASQEAAFAKLIEKRSADLEEAKRAEELARLSQESNNGGDSSGTPPVTSGSFMRPAQGYVSSEFEPRWGSFHYGLDIAKGGTVPIVASASGYVIRSYLSGSYGNAVFIAHDIDGQMFTTVYAHMRNREVSTGQWVNKGEIIGYMGNTGQSFGQHLHFEVHVGEWNGAKSNAVNPRNYVSF